VRLVSGLFKIVCATCPAHANVIASVVYQDGLLIHYECHGKTYLAAMSPYFSRVITHRDGERCQYTFNVKSPDVSCLREPIDCIHVLDTELKALSRGECVEMRRQLAAGFAKAEVAKRPDGYTEAEWSQLLSDGRKTLDLLTRFAETGW
jgi:hypothetical protein